MRLSDRIVRAILGLSVAFAIARVAVGVGGREPFDVDQALALAFGLLALFLLGSELHEARENHLERRRNRRNIVE